MILLLLYVHGQTYDVTHFNLSLCLLSYVGIYLSKDHFKLWNPRGNKTTSKFDEVTSVVEITRDKGEPLWAFLEWQKESYSLVATCTLLPLTMAFLSFWPFRSLGDLEETTQRLFSVAQRSSWKSPGLWKVERRKATVSAMYRSRNGSESFGLLKLLLVFSSWLTARDESSGQYRVSELASVLSSQIRSDISFEGFKSVFGAHSRTSTCMWLIGRMTFNLERDPAPDHLSLFGKKIFVLLEDRGASNQKFPFLCRRYPWNDSWSYNWQTDPRPKVRSFFEKDTYVSKQL